MDADEEDFVFYGKPIEREEDGGSRKKKAVAEASGQLRTLVPWKQEVRDEEGRRRFHGAFTGGFSAGYYNSVGSKEGWTPSTFTSSRKNRAEVKQQSIHNFLDEDEKAELEGRSLGTSMQFDTFGFTAVELVRKQAEKELQERPSAIPGPVPDELVAPVTESVGVKLLLKMGWRRGRSIKDSRTNSRYDARREARKSFLALASDEAKAQVAGSELAEEAIENVTDVQTDGDDHFAKSTPVYVLNPKQDLHGLGYDPYKNAPEFREKKRSRLSGNGEMGHRKPFSTRDSLFGFKSGRVAPGFGIGALEELDVEDEDVYGSGYDFEETYQVEDIEEPSRPTVANVKMLDNKEHGILPGFKAATNSDYQLERFDPPVIPKDFIAHHKFTAPLEVGNRVADVPPPEVPPPDDSNLTILIEGVASLVARCGKLFEDLSREKNQSNPLFAFLNGGHGHDYYERRLWEEQQKRNDKTKQQLDSKLFQNAKKMTAENRGKILGEKPLERSSRDSSSLVTSADTVNLQLNLSDTFTKPASSSDLPEVAKPFLDDPAKQDRFEQFLKEKYQGGLRAKDAGEISKMSEAARARERLEFEAAAEAIEKGKSGKESKPPRQLLADVLASSALQFTAGAVEQPKDSHDGLAPKSLYPIREEFQWRPAPILCKRFDLIDPFMGKPPPAPRARSKMESFLFVPDSTKAAKVQESVTMAMDLSSVAEVDREEATDKEIGVDIKPENVERPVDLYKAIFSDDSDEEEDITNPSQVDDPVKKIEVANTTLSRLIAGDFLESLGKELGLEVPPDMPYSESKPSLPAAQKESTNAKTEKERLQVGNTSSTFDAFGGNSISHELHVKPYHQEANQEGRSHAYETTDGNIYKSSSQINIKRNGDDTISKVNETGDYKNDASRNKLVKVAEEDRKSRTSKSGHRHLNSGLSEEERTRKRRHHQHGSRSSDSDTSSSSYDFEDRHRSRSKKKKKGSSREKSSSRSHSKHHKHKRRDSSHRSRHGSEKEHREVKKERHKHKD